MASMVAEAWLSCALHTLKQTLVESTRRIDWMPGLPRVVDCYISESLVQRQQIDCDCCLILWQVVLHLSHLWIRIKLRPLAEILKHHHCPTACIGCLFMPDDMAPTTTFNAMILKIQNLCPSCPFWRRINATDFAGSWNLSKMNTCSLGNRHRCMD